MARDKQTRGYNFISVLQCVAMAVTGLRSLTNKKGLSVVLQCCSVLQCIVFTGSQSVTNKQGVPVMLQCVAVCCSVLQAQVHGL